MSGSREKLQVSYMLLTVRDGRRSQPEDRGPRLQHQIRHARLH